MNRNRPDKSGAADERQGKEGGFVLIVVAILLVVLIGFVALGVDTGALYSARTSAQHIADAAALAGAGTFIVDPLAVDHDATAVLHATAVAETGSIMGVPVAAGDVTVVSDWANRRVTVTINSSQQTYFARVLWTGNVPVAVKSIAEASLNATSATSVKPFFMPNTFYGPNGTKPCDACAAGQVLIDSSGNKTAYADTQIGQEFVLKPGNPSQALSPSEYYLLQFPGATGGADVRAEIADPNPDPINCQDSYSVETGNKVGPVKQGVDDLIGNPPDTYVSPGHYQNQSTGLTSDLSPSLVLVPIWDSCSGGFCPSGQFGSGTNINVSVIGFALVFVEGTSGKNVNARLINVSSCGAAAGGAGGGTHDQGSTVLAIPLRLVRLP